MIFSAQEAGASISGPAGRIELRLQAGDPAGPQAALRAVAVIAHPHPLHGGSLSNKVVVTLARCYRDLGVDTVRFNFRGVGQSEGEYDQGRGEADDLAAVVQAAVTQADAQPARPLLLAGFSFGSAMVAARANALNARHLTLVAPPVERYPYGAGFDMPLCTLIGSADELVDVAAVQQWSEALPGRRSFHRLAGASHFFHGQLVLLKTTLAQQLAQDLEVLI